MLHYADEVPAAATQRLAAILREALFGTAFIHSAADVNGRPTAPAA